jgi:hypothetical protein
MATNIPTTAPRGILIKAMMEACDKDAKAQAALLKTPNEFAKKYNVTLEPDEEAQLKRVGELISLIDEFTAARIHGPGPIFYPADVWWKSTLSAHILGYQPLFNKLFPPKGYPIGPVFTTNREL